MLAAASLAEQTFFSARVLLHFFIFRINIFGQIAKDRHFGDSDKYLAFHIESCKKRPIFAQCQIFVASRFEREVKRPKR